MFPRTWSEELVSEWLQLKGYVVEAGIPIITMEAGGRAEADIIGYRVEDRVLKVWHIEVGALPGGMTDHGVQLNLLKFNEKFSPERRKAVKDYAKSKVNLPIEYRPTFISLFGRKHRASKLETKSEGREFWWMTDFIFDDVLKTIDEWKASRPYKQKSNVATLPDGLWLLKMLDHMTRFGTDKFILTQGGEG